MIDLEFSEPSPEPERPLVLPGTLRVVTALVAALLLASLGGGGRGERHEPAFRLRGTIEGAALVGDTLVVMTGEPARLRGYRASDGQPRWSQDLPTRLAFMSRHRDLLLVTEFDGLGDSLGRTRALDGRTGRELWRRTGLWIFATAGDRLMSARAVSESLGTQPASERVRISSVDAGTGAPLWSRDLPAGAVFTHDGGQPAYRGASGLMSGPVGDTQRLYDLDSEGVLRARDPATGDEIASTRLTAPPGPDLTVLGRVAVVRYPDGSISASDVTSGQTLWRRPADPTVEISGSCGDALCLAASNRTHLLDPLTGAPLYEFGTPTTAYRAGGRIVVIENASRRISLLDAATRRPLRELNGWSATGVYSGTRLVLVRGGLGEPARFADVDLLTGRPRVIARDDRGLVLPTCDGAGRHLVCWNSGALRAWSVSATRRGRGSAFGKVAPSR